MGRRKSTHCVTFLCLVIALGMPATGWSDTHVVPENVLVEWGYATTGLEPHQTIRQVRPLISPRSGETYHPRFDIWRECADSHDSAIALMRAKEAEIEAERAVIYKSAVGMIVREECVFFVSAHGTFFMLEFQPFIMGKLQEYLCEDKQCVRSTIMDDL